MSTDTTFEADASVTEVNGIGSATAALLEADTIAELAATPTEEAIEQTVGENKSIDDDAVASAVRRARTGLGYGPHDIPEDLVDGDDSDSSSEPAAPSSASDLLGEMSSDIETSTDHNAVVVVAGNDSFERARNDAARRGEEFNPASTVMVRLVDAGLVDLAEGEFLFDELVMVDRRYGSNAGAEWALKWVENTEDTQFELPDITFVSLAPVEQSTTYEDGTEFIAVGEGPMDDWESQDWAQAYERRRSAAIERAHTLVVVENGDGVGRWVIEANQAGLEIEAPEYNPDGDDDESDDDDDNEMDNDSNDSDDGGNSGTGTTVSTDADDSVSDEADDSNEAPDAIARAVDPDGPDWSEAAEAEAEAGAVGEDSDAVDDVGPDVVLAE